MNRLTLKHYQTFILFAALAYPLIGLFFIPDRNPAIDPFWERALFTPFFLGLAALVGSLGISSRVAGTLSLLLTVSITAHAFILLNRDPGQIAYVTQVMLIIFGYGAAVFSKARLTIYTGAVLALLAFFEPASLPVSHHAFYAGIALTLVVSFLGLLGKTRIFTEVAESARVFKDLFDASNDGLAIVKLGRVIEVNPGLGELLGREPSELKNLPVSSVLESASEGGQVPFELDIRRANGRRTHVSVTRKGLLYNGEYVELLMFRDITGKKRFAMLNETFLSFGADPLKNIQRLTRFCGEALGGTFVTYSRIENGRLVARGSWYAAGPIDEKIVEQTIYCNEQTIGSLSIGYSAGYVASIEDEQMLRLIANAIGVQELILEQQSRAALNTRMSALGEMASGIAHEVNNPVAIIDGKAKQLSYLANLGNASPEMIRKNAEVISKTALRIAKIVKGLRHFARDADRDPYQRVGAKQIIENALEFCTERFKNSNVDLQVSPIREGLEIDCRPSQISQALLNILNNSFDAVKGQSEQWVRVEVTEQGTHVEVSITDSGAGIAPEHRDKILQPFFTTKQVNEGVGLGLSVSKGLIESHRGVLRVDPKSSNTRIVVTLPMKQGNEQAMEVAL